jgi:hypothetical protein
MNVRITLRRKTDGRWIVQARKMGVLLYGATRADAATRATATVFAALAGSIQASEEAAPRSLAFEVAGPRAKKRTGTRRRSSGSTVGRSTSPRGSRTRHQDGDSCA